MNKTKINHWKWFLNEWRGYGLYCAWLVFLTILSTLVSIIYPVFFKYLIDAVAGTLGAMSAEEAVRTRTRFIFILFGIGFFRFVSALYPAFRARMNLVIERNVRERYFDYIIEKSHRFFQTFRTGDIVTRLTDDLSNYPKIAWFACSGIFRAFNSASIVFFCVIAMMWLNWRLALITILPLPLCVLVFLKIQKRLRKAFDDNQKTISETNNHLETCFSGVRILKAYNATERQARMFERVLERRFDAEMGVNRTSGMMHIFYEFINQVAQVLVVLVGGIMVIRGTLTVGDYYAFFTYLSMIVWPMLDIPVLLVTSRQAFVCVDRLEELKNFEAGYRDAPERELKISGIESIKLENVRFSYMSKKENNSYSGGNAALSPDRTSAAYAGETAACVDENRHFKGNELAGDNEMVGKNGGNLMKETVPAKNTAAFELADINLEIKAGEKIAIVGQIGSGKTTLLNIIAGIIKPDGGKILINGIPVENIDESSFRAKTGYVGQEPVVFSETVRQNIAFWREYRDEDVYGAARLAQLDREIENFPNRYMEEIGQRGTTVSGGQKQRLTIGRAVIGSPELLIMDDVTASLDAENEEKFWNDMEEKFGKITAVIVTHRMRTAERAHRIVVMKEGRIEAIGSYNELLEISPTFRKLAQG